MWRRDTRKAIKLSGNRGFKKDERKNFKKREDDRSRIQANKSQDT